MKPELIVGMSLEEYHSKKEFVSNSMLSEFLRSPAHLQAALRNPEEQTKAQADGELIHSAILEPELLSKKFVPALDPKDYPGALISGDDLKARCKELGVPVSGTKAELSKRIVEKDPKAVIWDTLVSQHGSKHAGKTFIKPEDLKSLERLVESVYSHDHASQSLSGGMCEVSIFWTDPETGVKCRCRPDYYIKSGPLLVDVKSTEDARLTAFQRSLYNFGYYRQLAFYALGLRAMGFAVETFRIIAVEKSEPWAVSVFDVDSVSINRGLGEIREALKRYAECEKAGHWPAYPDAVEMISLPSYAF